MSKFIVFTFLILGWTFYEMSGGSDFVPQERQVAQVEAAESTPAVTRSAATPTLISLSRPVTDATSEPAVAAEVIAPITQATFETVDDTPAAEPEVDPVVETVETPQVTPPPLDLRLVDARRVNMRAGPGTNFGVIDAFDRGTEAEVLLVDATGWAQIRITSTGQTGWMAERLLTDG